MFTHMHFYNLNMLLIMGARSTKVETVLQVAFVLFLSPIDHCGGGMVFQNVSPDFGSFWVPRRLVAKMLLHIEINLV